MLPKDLEIKIIWAWPNAMICVYEKALNTEQAFTRSYLAF